MRNIIRDNKRVQKHLLKLLNANCVSKVKTLQHYIMSYNDSNELIIMGTFLNENGLIMKFKITINNEIKNVKIFIKSIDK